MSKRILIADDSAVMRRQVRLILEEDGSMEVCAEACDGLEAVEKTQECHPDMAVLDLVMPKMNGLEATRAIKRLMPRLPILLFTLHDSPALEQESRRAGVDMILPKTQGSARLSSAVHSLLG